MDSDHLLQRISVRNNPVYKSQSCLAPPQKKTSIRKQRRPGLKWVVRVKSYVPSQTRQVSADGGLSTSWIASAHPQVDDGGTSGGLLTLQEVSG